MATTKPKTGNLLTPVFRASYPHLFKAHANRDIPNSTPKFSVCALWTPAKFSDHEKKLWSAILKALDDESQSVFKVPFKELAKKMPTVKRGIRNGIERAGKEGYGEGVRFANLTSLERPGVIDAKTKEDIDDTSEIYAGCYLQATVRVYSFDKGGGKGLALGLQNVRKVKDGPRLDNRKSAQDDFNEDVESQWLEGEDDFDADGGDTDDGDEDAF